MKKDTKLTAKEQLRAELDIIERAERLEMQEANWPRISHWMGKYFKYRNSYGVGGKADWWLYKKITNIKKDDIYTVTDGSASAHVETYGFQTDCYGCITINQKNTDYLHNMGQEITEREFNEAWNKMIEKLNNIK